MKKAITSVKDALLNDNVIITKIIQGHSGSVRIDARTRNHIADYDNFFSEWVSFKYANNLCKNIYDKPLTELKAYQY